MIFYLDVLNLKAWALYIALPYTILLLFAAQIH